MQNNLQVFAKFGIVKKVKFLVLRFKIDTTVSFFTFCFFWPPLFFFFFLLFLNVKADDITSGKREAVSARAVQGQMG